MPLNYVGSPSRLGNPGGVAEAESNPGGEAEAEAEGDPGGEAEADGNPGGEVEAEVDPGGEAEAEGNPGGEAEAEEGDIPPGVNTVAEGTGYSLVNMASIATTSQRMGGMGTRPRAPHSPLHMTL